MDKEFDTTRTIVTKILKNSVMARNSDAILYIEVVRILNKGALNKPFVIVMRNLNKLGLPCFETVRRTRQHIQADHPELKACKKIERKRKKKEKEYRKEFGRCSHS